ncbi:hypothetical protein ACO22_01110 [Paracoccidioides brasiliensis]|uniref:Uncharacterized protein n=1 Tax=Paracoccidioides brasiliensis TaxID=121759 RepID=A0A1D2JMJ3_PARBR|nr:hypothetical protein ACO22_01110 [Paracoccidioides brasiliensis]
MQEKIQKQLEKAKTVQKAYYDSKHSAKRFHVGDWVLLNAKNFRMLCPTRKLDHKFKTIAGKTGLSIPQLLSITCDYGTSQHLKDLGHFPGPHLQRALPMQPPPTVIEAIFLAMATVLQLPLTPSQHLALHTLSLEGNRTKLFACQNYFKTPIPRKSV